MKSVLSSVTLKDEIIGENLLTGIEEAARTCYKSKDRITSQSAKKMCSFLLEKGHTSVFEHGNIVVKLNLNNDHFMIQGHHPDKIYDKFSKSHIMKNMRMTTIREGSTYNFYIGGNVRAWLNLVNFISSDGYFISNEIDIMIMSQILHIVFMKLSKYKNTKFFFSKIQEKRFQKFLSPYYNVIGNIINTEKDSIKILDTLEDESFYIQSQFRRFSFNIICDRGLAYAIIRHRELPCVEVDELSNSCYIGYAGNVDINLSVSQESTRWVNYFKKDGGDIEFIIPVEIKDNKDAIEIWEEACSDAEEKYVELIESGHKPQVARSVLPNATKTELVLSGYSDQLKSFLDLRLPADAGPQMNNIALPIKNALKRFL